MSKPTYSELKAKLKKELKEELLAEFQGEFSFEIEHYIQRLHEEAINKLKEELKQQILAEFQTDLSFERASFQKELNKELTAQKELMINDVVKLIEQKTSNNALILSALEDKINHFSARINKVNKELTAVKESMVEDMRAYLDQTSILLSTLEDKITHLSARVNIVEINQKDIDRRQTKFNLDLTDFYAYKQVIADLKLELEKTKREIKSMDELRHESINYMLKDFKARLQDEVKTEISKMTHLGVKYGSVFSSIWSRLDELEKRKASIKTQLEQCDYLALKEQLKHLNDHFVLIVQDVNKKITDFKDEIQTQKNESSSLILQAKLNSLDTAIRLLGRETQNTDYNLQQLQKKFTKFVDSPRDDKLLDEMQSFVDNINEQQKEIDNYRSQLKVEIARVQALQDEIQGQDKKELNEIKNDIRALGIELDVLSEVKDKIPDSLQIEIDGINSNVQYLNEKLKVISKIIIDKFNFNELEPSKSYQEYLKYTADDFLSDDKVDKQQVPDLLVSQIKWNSRYATRYGTNALIGFISFLQENTSWSKSNDSISSLEESIISATIYFRLSEAIPESEVFTIIPNKNGEYWTDCPIEIPDKFLTLNEVEYYLQQLKNL